MSEDQHQWMEKIHYQDDQNDVIKTAGYRFQFFDGDSAVTKSASEAISRKNADAWKPDSRHFGLHVIAMGSEESVGPNRNGDGWPAQALRDYHPTFTKCGCFFREHKNRCQKTEGIGTIKMAAYNEPMSRVELVIWGDKRKAEEEYEMAKAGKELSFSMSARMPYDRCKICDQKSRRQSDYCFVPGTLITMADGTTRDVMFVREGDSVLDADGHPTRVVAAAVRRVSEEVVVFENSLNGHVTAVTGNHPFLALPAEAGDMLPICNRRNSRRLNSLPLSDVKGWEKFIPKPDFVQAGDLRFGDFIVAPAVEKRPELWDGFCDEDDAWVYGLFLAEGSYGKQTRKDGSKVRCSLQFSLHEDEKDYVVRLTRYFSERHGKSVKIYSSKRSKGVSVRVHSKSVSATFLAICGEYAHEKKLDTRFMHAPVGIQSALLAGIYDGDGCVYDRRSAGKKNYSRINLVAEQLIAQLWHLLTRDGEFCYTARSLQPLGPEGRKKYPGASNKLPITYLSSSFMGDADAVSSGKGFLAGRAVGHITKLDHTRYDGPVHSLETESGTYVANGLAVHNCDHLKDHMLQYIPQLKKTAYAVNKDDLKFFDISRVGRRADRVATYIRYMFGDDMSKAASFGERIITGADWASMEFGGQPGLGSDLLRTFTPWETATLEKLAAAEAELAHTPNAAVIAGAPGRGVPQRVILAFANQDLPSVGGALAKKAMVLDFKSFTSLVSGINLTELDNDAGFHKVALAELPRLFTDIMAKGGCECGEAATMVAPDELGCALSQDKDLIDDMIADVGDNLGMEQGRMQSRAVLSLDKSASVAAPPTVDSGNSAFFSRTLAAYGYYVVKAAHIALRTERVPATLMLRAIPAMNRNTL